MKKLVIALGGNALGNTPYEQLALVTKTAKPIVDLIEAGNQVIIAHGNGPQVGMINLAMSTAANAKAIKSDMPFPECGAMSQGYIGYHLQNSIQNELKARGIEKSVATVVTQVLVDENDPAFQHPSKPIGAFYSKEEADRIAAEKGYTMVEDAGRGYRQVVPSPKPVDVVEKDMVNTLIDAGHVVITVGGGGIPVIEKDGKLLGVPAVIDKHLRHDRCDRFLDAAGAQFVLNAVLQMIADIALAHRAAFRERHIGLDRLGFRGGAHAEIDHADLRSVAVRDHDLVARFDQIDDRFRRFAHQFELFIRRVAQRVSAEGDDEFLHV